MNARFRRYFCGMVTTGGIQWPGMRERSTAPYLSATPSERNTSVTPGRSTPDASERQESYPGRKVEEVKDRTTYLALRGLRLFNFLWLNRAALPFAALAFLTATLICWAGGNRASWAQEETTLPSVDFRASPLEAEVEEEGEPTKEVVVTNVDGQDGGLEFSADIQGVEGLLRSGDSSSLSFLDDPLTLKVSQEDIEKDEDKDAYLYVRNGSNLSMNLDFSTRLRDKNGNIQEVMFNPRGSTSADPRSVTAVHLVMESGQLEGLEMPLKGFLVVAGTKGSVPDETVEVASGALQITIASYEPRNAWFGGEYSIDPRIPVLLLPFVASAALIGGAYYLFRKKVPGAKDYCPLLGGKMNALGTELGFDPTKSWATVLTAVATLATSVTGATVLPETRVTFTKNDVAVLAISFGALLLVSPMIYNGFRKPKPEQPPQDEEEDSSKTEAPALGTEPALRGYVFSLLVTSAGILGALLGQLTLAILVVNEIENVDVTDFNRGLLWALLGVSVVYACVYVCRSVWSTLKGEVRWGESLKQQLDELEGQRERMEELRSRIAHRNKELEGILRKSIDLEITEIDKKIQEIEEQREFGTGQRALTLL